MGTKLISDDTLEAKTQVLQTLLAPELGSRSIPYVARCALQFRVSGSNGLTASAPYIVQVSGLFRYPYLQLLVYAPRGHRADNVELGVYHFCTGDRPLILPPEGAFAALGGWRGPMFLSTRLQHSSVRGALRRDRRRR